MRSEWIGRAALLGTLLLAPSVAAKQVCSEGSRCDRPEVVAEVRAAIDAVCPCEAQPTKRAYRRCAKQELKRQRQLLGDDLSKPCRREIARAYKNAVCGRPGTVPCNKTNRKGRTSCVVTTESRCPTVPGRSSPCGAFTACVDACVPAGGCPDVPPTTLPPSTTTSTSLVTTTTASSTSSSLPTSTTMVTTTTVAGSTTTTSLATTLPCADANLGTASPLAVSATTVGAANDIEPPEACQSFPMTGGGDVFYEWTAPASGVFVFDTRSTPFDSIVLVLDDCGGTVLGCNDDPEGFGVLGSRTQASLTEGQTVLVVVDSASDPGPYTLAITGPFAADDCCVTHGTSGCDVPATESCVCGADAVCCTDPWDGLCVWRAIARCDATCD